MSGSGCTETVGPVWADDGETHACILPAAHVFDRDTAWHRCSCRTTWVDDQQIAESRDRQSGSYPGS